jgi:hypothetical protein
METPDKRVDRLKANSESIDSVRGEPAEPRTKTCDQD